MYRLNLFDPDQSIESCKSFLECLGGTEVIASHKGMAGIKTYPQALGIMAVLGCLGLDMGK